MKDYDTKISQSVIYVKEYSCMFFSTLEDILQEQSQTKDGVS